jgi:transcription elongation GreA/GreB family factor
MDKVYLLKQLVEKLRAISQGALKADEEALGEAKSGAQRAINLSRGTRMRLEAAQAAWMAVADFKLVPMKRGSPAGLGSIVEIEDEESGGKTLFIAPAGAGEELTFADGDGFLNVVTLQSPLGRAVLGKRVNEAFDVMLRGEPVNGRVTFVG